MLIKFDAVLAESVDIVPLLLNLCQVVTEIVDQLREGDLLNLPLLGPVVDDKLRLDDAHRHLQEGQPARDFASGHLVGVDKPHLAGLKRRLACPCHVVLENEAEGG